MKSILISGASGLVGKALSKKLKEKGYEVRQLSRTKKQGTFFWDPAEGKIEEKAFENLDGIIHLAGAPISKRWTNSHKKEMYESRVNTAQLLFNYTKNLGINLGTFISASGINYYGTQTTSVVYKETDKHRNDFLGSLCYDLEKTADSFLTLDTRVCCVRTSAVLSTEGGVLKELMPLVKKNMLTVLGTGKQILPWIHIDDIVGIYIYLLENENMSGAYNACASEIITNKEFTHQLAKNTSSKIIFPAAPKWLLKMVLGEMSGILIEGSAISNQKIKEAGYTFQYENLDAAFSQLFQTKNR